jgi:hypothetical protein
MLVISISSSGREIHYCCGMLAQSESEIDR